MTILDDKTAAQTKGSDFSHNDFIYLKGITTPGDGGQGYFRLDTSGTLGAGAEDGIFTIATTGPTNSYWRRIAQGELTDIVTTAISATDTTITHPTLWDLVGVGDWVIVGAHTTDAEMRKVTAVSAGLVTVSRQFAKPHAVGERIVVSTSAERNVTFWAAKGDGVTVDSLAVQEAVNDLDIVVDANAVDSSGTISSVDTGTDTLTSNAHGMEDRDPVFFTTTDTLPAPLLANRIYFVRDVTTNTFKVSLTSGGTAIDITSGGSGTNTWNKQLWTQANNLYFPSGDYLLDATITLPNVTVFLTAGCLVHGSNATITTKTFDGPLFKGARPTGGNSKYEFTRLRFRDSTASGTAHVFSWNLYRAYIHHCRFEEFESIVRSADTSDAAQFIQSVTFDHNNCAGCKDVILVSKAFDLTASNNKTDGCRSFVRCIASTATLLNGRIYNNTLQGTVNSSQSRIEINGPRALHVWGNYFEKNGPTGGSSGASEINIGTAVPGAQPRGVVIGPANRFAPRITGGSGTAQDQDANYYPIEMNAITNGLTIFGNQSEGPLIDPNTQSSDFGENWHIFGNHILFGDPKSQTEHLSRGTRVVTRLGRLQTSNATATNMEFGDGSQVFNAGEAPAGATFAVEAEVTARHTSAANAMKYHIAALFVQDGTTFVQDGATQDVHAAIGGETWTLDLSVTDSSDDFTADDTTDELTSVGHGLSNGDKIYFTTTGTLPAPLVANTPYFVRDATANTFKLWRGPGTGGSDRIDITDTGGGSDTHTWFKQEINLVCTGAASTTIDWRAKATIQISP